MSKSILQKTIGLVSTLILARVLVPEDFGIVAMASIIIGLLGVLAQTGASEYLLRADTINKDMLNTSWTINLLLKLCLAGILVLITPYAADFYGDERLISILYFTSGLMLFNCLGSPGAIYYKREQNYLPTIKVEIIAKILAVCVSITIALIYESYWALILGQATSGVVGTIGSHLIHPHRPRPCLKNAREQWGFSGWMIPQSIFGYARTQLDTFMVSAYFGQAQLGSYHVMKYLAFIPSQFIIQPATQPLLVEMAKIKYNKAHFARQYNVCFLVTMLVALPITAMMYTHADVIIEVFLGPKWVEFSPLLSVFSFLIPAMVMLNQGRRVLLVYGKTKHMLYYEILAFSLLYSTLFLIGFSDVFLFTNIRVGLETVLSFIFMIYITIKYTTFKNSVTLCVITVPVIIGCVLGSYISEKTILENDFVFIELITKGLIFSFCYLIVLLFSYFLIMKKTYEWSYLENLTKKTLETIKKRLKNKPSQHGQ